MEIITAILLIQVISAESGKVSLSSDFSNKMNY